jgi:hypothetical protein
LTFGTVATGAILPAAVPLARETKEGIRMRIDEADILGSSVFLMKNKDYDAGMIAIEEKRIKWIYTSYHGLYAITSLELASCTH